MRLIDIEPFETEANLIWCHVSRTHGGDGFINVANTNTKEIPTIDAVEVVRCKDCKHRDAIFVCAQFDADVGAMHFCSLGERRNDG